MMLSQRIAAPNVIIASKSLHPCIRVLGSCPFGKSCMYASHSRNFCWNCVAYGNCTTRNCPYVHPDSHSKPEEDNNEEDDEEDNDNSLTSSQSSLSEEEEEEEEEAVGTNYYSDSETSTQSSSSQAKHPCIAVYGKCLSGDKCRYANHPRYCCLFCLKGTCDPLRCKYPPVPEEEEAVVGTNYYSDSETSTQSSSQAKHPCIAIYGKCLSGDKCKYASHPRYCCLFCLKGTCDPLRCKYPPAPVPSEEEENDEEEDDEEDDDNSSTSSKSREEEEKVVGTNCYSDSETSTQSSSQAKHPCIAVYGKCVSGDKCRYANHPRYCCLFCLKGTCDPLRCKYSAPAKHPCIAVYGKCLSGDKCKYANHPRYCCLFCLKGTCDPLRCKYPPAPMSSSASESSTCNDTSICEPSTCTDTSISPQIDCNSNQQLTFESFFGDSVTSKTTSSASKFPIEFDDFFN